MSGTWSPLKTVCIVLLGGIVWLAATYALAVLANYLPILETNRTLSSIAIWTFLFLFPILLIERASERVLDDHPIFMRTPERYIRTIKLICMIGLSVALVIWIAWVVAASTDRWAVDLPDAPVPTVEMTMIMCVFLTFLLRVLIWLPLKSGQSENHSGDWQVMIPPRTELPRAE